ncbi:MAG TPA: type VI secretion system membrane subunit TssM [Gammaproteobacteria bacterium]|nr:type VI secretion system membrane subunit TssM [Gammaproteobacteria bacterium]
MIREFVRKTLNRQQSLTPSRALSQDDWRIEHATAKLTILEQSIKDALRFLKKKYRKSIFYRHKLPWYLVLGAEGVGKTSLLGMSDLNLLSTNNQPLKLPHTTAYCDWLFGKEAVFIDVNGALMLPDDPKNDSHLIWKKFIELLHQNRHRYRAVDGLMICIDLHQFLSKNRGQRQLQIDILRHRVQSLTKYLKTLPVYLIFTKCDRIAGFTDSFNTLSPEDCQQTFGISLPQNLMQQNLAPHLEQQFNLFLSRLNEQLIPRLHREHNLEKRNRIKDFPLQLEALKRDIITLATQLHSTRTSLSGIYFTSSHQDGLITDGLSPLLYTFGLPTIPQVNFQPQQRAFFIHQPLEKIIHHKIIPIKKVPALLNWQSKHFYMGWGALLAVACLILIPEYFYNAHTLSRTKEIMAQYQPATDNNTPEAYLPSLNILRRAVDQAREHSNPLLTLVFHQARTIKNDLTTTYIQALNSQLAPLLKQILEQQLQATAHVKPQEYFDALKTYLMLEDSSHLDTDFVIGWFNRYWRENLANNPQKRKQLNAHLAFWLKQRPLEFATDAQIVQLARQRLNSLPLAEIAYLTLQESYKATATLAPNTSADTVNPAFSIPPEHAPLYQAKNFNAVYQTQIPQLVQQIATGDNWVLNLTLPANLTTALTAQLVSSLRHMYIQRYADFWLGELLNIQPGQFSTLADASAFTRTLTSVDSPLMPLLDTVSANLKPIANYPEAQASIQTLQQLQNLLLDSAKNSNVQKALIGLTKYLDGIVNAKDSGEAALNAAKHRMHNDGQNDAISQLYTVANSAPAPLNNWLNALAQNSWRSILKTASNHINLLWLTQVIPDYNEYINNRYPVFSDATLDMNLTEFAHFFGPEGTIDTFTKQLSAFIDNSQLYWKWKYVDGQTLHISQKSLEMLDRAALIQKMYFSNNQKMPTVGFSIMPVDSALMATNYVLNLNGQTINYLNDFHQNKKINWPGAHQDHAQLALMQGSKKIVFFEENGPWAVFKLLAQGRLTPSHNSQLYQLLFNVNGTNVTYQLLADKPINPFVPLILSEFRCPEKL